MSKRNHSGATGSRTAAGKAISSQNARTHGLTAATLQLSPDDRERYNELRRELTTEIAPQGPIEQLLFNRLLHAAWSLERIPTLEDTLRRQGPDFAVPERSVWRGGGGGAADPGSWYRGGSGTALPLFR